MDIKVLICKRAIGRHGDCREAHALSKDWRQAALQATTSLRLDGMRLCHSHHRNMLKVFYNLTELQLDLRGFDLPFLGFTWLADCPKLMELDVLGGADSNLTCLDSIKGLSKLDLSYKDTRAVKKRGGLRRLPAFDRDNSLRAFKLSWTRVKDLAPLSQLRLLECLDLRGTSITSLLPLTALAALSRLDLSSVDTNIDLAPLSRLVSLRELSAGDVEVDFMPVTALTGLTSLSLPGAENYGELTSLATLTALQKLSLQGWDEPPTYTGLTRLTYLDVRDTELSDLEGLTSLRSLVELWVDCNPVKDLKPLTVLTRLGVLGISSTRVSDLKPLKLITSLKRLKIWPAIESLTGPL